MNASEIYHQFQQGLYATSWPEGIAVIAGIISVWFSKKENILVYPTGLINTILYIYLSAKGALYGEASVNLYYTVMSLYGWFQWNRKDTAQHPLLQISFSNKNWIVLQCGFFLFFFILLLLILQVLRIYFAEDVIPLADAFASASAFTGMWLMTRKKVESWYWWILTNLISIPLYFVKGYVVTSFYYLILLILAFSGLISWKQKTSTLSS